MKLMVHQTKPPLNSEEVMHLHLTCGTRKKSLLQERGLQAANTSRSPLVRHFDWHNQVTTKLKGKGHQRELASLCCTNDQ